MAFSELIGIISCVTILLALAQRMDESDNREASRRKRISDRTNKSAWIRNKNK